MGNDITKSSSKMLVNTNTFIEKLSKFAEMTKLEFTDYQRLCVSNGVRIINNMLDSKGMTWNDLTIDNVYNVLQQTAFLHLNPGATPKECYYIIRKEKTSTGQYKEVLEFGIEGAGNDVILREFGVNVKEIRSYAVYEGDEFDQGEFDGWEIKLPRHRRMFKSQKLKYAVYMVKKINGEFDLTIAEREDVKKSLLANAKQNGASDELLLDLEKESLDELLTNPKWLKYRIKKTYGTKVVETPLFNPSYTSPVSRESMIERKMRNHAVRRYPKNFNPEVQRLYEDTFEDEKYGKQEIELVEPKMILEQSDENFEKESMKQSLKNPKEKLPKISVEEDEDEVVTYNADDVENEIHELDVSEVEIESVEEEIIEDEENEEAIEEEIKPDGEELPDFFNF